MSNKAKILLYEPNSEQPGKYFSLRLKKELYNEPSEYSKPAKVLAISNIEGNFRFLHDILIRNGVIDSNYKWTFGDGHLVIVGGCFDSSEQTIECLWLIYSLENRAHREGGYVHFILGNNEMMNLNGNWRFVHPKYAIKKQSSRSSTIALYDGSNELWRWLCTKNIMEKIGDILFVHGGIASEINQLNLSITEINKVVRPYYTHISNLHTNPILSIILNSEVSPFRFKRYFQQPFSEDIIDDTLTKFGVKAIITGNRAVGNIDSFFNGKVINIDTAHVTDNFEVLLIENNEFYWIGAKGKQNKIK